MLELSGLLLAVMHFGLPLAYYLYAKSQWLPRPWNLRITRNYMPHVTIIIPTYNEADVIEGRLNNVYVQKHPRSLIEVIVIDSGSLDGTPDFVEGWAKQHDDLDLKIVKEEVCRGKARALNEALRHASGEIVIVADADAFWDENALANAIKLFSDPSVGAVSCLKKPLERGSTSVEDSYRLYYYNSLFSKPIKRARFHHKLYIMLRSLANSLGMEVIHLHIQWLASGLAPFKLFDKAVLLTLHADLGNNLTSKNVKSLKDSTRSDF